MKISTLIVDDQDDIRFLVSTIIEDANDGLTVCGEAADGAEALEFLERDRPSIIVLDEMMPGMSGLETAAEILRRHPDQRILLFSAYLDAALVQRAALAGVTACLPKDRVMEIPDTLRAIA
jgi:DNA-binding NarL/FixJ family response regulator